MQFKQFFPLFLFILIYSQIAYTDSDIQLAPLVKEGLPGDLLIEDSIVSPLHGSTALNSGTGSLQNSLQNQMAFPILDSGRPGNLAQLRGFAFSSEDTDVQIMGISVNPPQGGGFDLSIFPQYLWSDYRFQLGPSLNALNQSASAGTLSLVPWTSTALRQKASGGRAIGFYSSLGVNQISAAAKDGKNVAVVAGYSSQKVQGPSAGVSARWEKGDYSGSIHLLATDLDAESLGPTFDPTPEARMRTIRIIPVFQNDFRLSRRSLLKTSVFYDWTYLNYNNPNGFPQGSPNYSKDNVQQWGAENVYLVDHWKWGLSARQVSYQTLSSYLNFRAPTQTIGNLQVSREFEVGSWTFEPTVHGVWVTDFGFQPQGSFGARREWDRGQKALFSRISFSKRIPTLLDRYAVFTEFTGNPQLQSELDWTGILGGEIKNKRFEGSLQGYTQLKQRARVFTGNTVQSLENASVYAVSGSGKVQLTRFLEGFSSLTVSTSHLDATGNAFPFVPPWLGVSGFALHDSRDLRRWEWVGFLRFSSSQITQAVTGSSVPGYMVFDTGAQLHFGSGMTLSGRIENVFNRSIEVVRGYPVERAVSMMLIGEI